jgi:hypothetical protein
MPEEDKLLGAPRALAQLFKTVLSPDPAMDRTEPPQYAPNGRVVGHYVLGVARHRFNQRHVRRPTKPVVADHVARGAHQCVDQITSRHVQHGDR